MADTAGKGRWPVTQKRLFTKAEIRDAAEAAADNGLDVILHPSGEMRFTHAPVENRDDAVTALEAFKQKNGGQGHGRSRRHDA